MKLGVTIRLMGPQSTRDTVLACAQAAEAGGVDDLWVPDHIAIAPDDSEGSGGRYLDPLASLAWLAAKTERIGLGTGVLILPYRAALPTAKAIATVQELSAGRLRLGVGVGWLASEFRALGVEREHRGRLTDETLGFLRECFANDEVEANGQPFLFLPRPEPPPIYVGGAAPHALARTVRYGDGWMPMGGDAASLAREVATLHAMAAEVGRTALEVELMTGLPLDDPSADAAQIHSLAEAGITGLIVGWRYADASEFVRKLDLLVEHVLPVVKALSTH